MYSSISASRLTWSGPYVQSIKYNKIHPSSDGQELVVGFDRWYEFARVKPRGVLYLAPSKTLGWMSGLFCNIFRLEFPIILNLMHRCGEENLQMLARPTHNSYFNVPSER